MKIDEAIHYMDILKKCYEVMQPEIRDAVDMSIMALNVLEGVEKGLLE